jgi:hypothetical protein
MATTSERSASQPLDAPRFVMSMGASLWFVSHASLVASKEFGGRAGHRDLRSDNFGDHRHTGPRPAG